jgi:hypothetical protein
VAEDGQCALFRLASFSDACPPQTAPPPPNATDPWHPTPAPTTTAAHLQMLPCMQGGPPPSSTAILSWLQGAQPHAAQYDAASPGQPCLNTPAEHNAWRTSSARPAPMKHHPRRPPGPPAHWCSPSQPHGTRYADDDLCKCRSDTHRTSTGVGHQPPGATGRHRQALLEQDNRCRRESWSRPHPTSATHAPPNQRPAGQRKLPPPPEHTLNTAWGQPPWYLLLQCTISCARHVMPRRGIGCTAGRCLGTAVVADSVTRDRCTRRCQPRLPGPSNAQLNKLPPPGHTFNTAWRQPSWYLLLQITICTHDVPRRCIGCTAGRCLRKAGVADSVTRDERRTTRSATPAPANQRTTGPAPNTT